MIAVDLGLEEPRLFRERQRAQLDQPDAAGGRTPHPAARVDYDLAHLVVRQPPFPLAHFPSGGTQVNEPVDGTDPNVAGTTGGQRHRLRQWQSVLGTVEAKRVGGQVVASEAFGRCDPQRPRAIERETDDSVRRPAPRALAGDQTAEVELLPVSGRSDSEEQALVIGDCEERPVCGGCERSNRPRAVFNDSGARRRRVGGR